MKNNEGKPLANLIHQLSRLPGIGEKSATRLAYFILESDQEFASELAKSIDRAKEEIHECPICKTYTDRTPCSICNSDFREKNIICVVETPKDLHSIERTNKYNGLYHVLHGVIIPERGITPDKLRIVSLLERVRDEKIDEVILATNPTKNGEITALFIAEQLKDTGVNVSRLAYGIPMGGDIDYYDDLTIATALRNRTFFQS